jgi:hypothetical protein
MQNGSHGTDSNGTRPPLAETVRSAVAVEMFEITQRLPSAALEQVLAFVHLLDEPAGVDAQMTVEAGHLKLVITAPMEEAPASGVDHAGRRRSA